MQFSTPQPRTMHEIAQSTATHVFRRDCFVFRMDSLEDTAGVRIIARAKRRRSLGCSCMLDPISAITPRPPPSLSIEDSSIEATVVWCGVYADACPIYINDGMDLMNSSNRTEVTADGSPLTMALVRCVCIVSCISCVFTATWFRARSLCGGNASTAAMVASEC